MTDLKNLVELTQINKTHKGWYEQINDKDCLKYIAWVACDHLDGKKANAPAMKRILFNHFKLTISESSIKTWLLKVETGEVTYERPDQETG